MLTRFIELTQSTWDGNGIHLEGEGSGIALQLTNGTPRRDCPLFRPAKVERSWVIITRAKERTGLDAHAPTLEELLGRNGSPAKGRSCEGIIP